MCWKWLIFWTKLKIYTSWNCNERYYFVENMYCDIFSLSILDILLSSFVDWKWCFKSLSTFLDIISWNHTSFKPKKNCNVREVSKAYSLLITYLIWYFATNVSLSHCEWFIKIWTKIATSFPLVLFDF